MISQAVRVLGLILMVVFAWRLPAVASCGQGQTPSFGDVVAVRYEKTACYGHCGSYEVLFSRHGLYYVGRSETSRHGTYEASDGGALQRVTAILEQHRFFSLNVVPNEITDVQHYIIAVERCGVTTKLDWPKAGSRADIEALFEALDGITNSITWKKSGESLESPMEREASIVRR